MEQADIKLFRLKNKLKQQDLATFLGVTAAFLSQIENGTRKAPKELLNKLTENKEWDTSMFGDGTQIIAGNNNGGDAVVNIGARGTSKGASERVAALEAENEMLRTQVDLLRELSRSKDEQIKLLKGLQKN